MLAELAEILTEYADDENYYTTKRDCEWVTNGVTEETFSEFFGDSEGAKRGLEIVRLLQANVEISVEKGKNKNG